MTTARKRRGRPPFLWRSEAGKAFVNAVFAIQSEHHPIKTAKAIRRVLYENPEFAYLDKQYSPRYLEKKFQEVADSSAYWRLGKKYRKTIYRNKKNN
jgi:hypothetical protein